MAELVDALASKASVERRTGSIPVRPTKMGDWWNGIHAGFRNLCQQWLESSSLSSPTK